ncbi:MAG: ABC transporter permease [Acidobacteria bacterium]|nr:ABC transporter permease [Acidobacteriota bacterium]MCI0620792.1 ABC transporter permease [Acidobacteriota bacterium]MCI0722392.1 ABC transporter permease [Acidobacteriota bacterium]
MNAALFWQQIGSNRLALFGALIAACLVLVALLAPALTPHTFDSQNLPLRLHAPSRAHWFGTDELGRDIFSRVAYGTRISMLVGVSVVFVSSSVGLFAGSLAGYYGGWLDEFLMRVVDVLLAFPGILLAIALVAFWGPGLEKLILALVAVGWVGYARLVRGQILKVKELDFVKAARSLGASDARIVLRHLLPNIIQPVLVQASIGMAGAILAEASLSFLGLGVPPPLPSWGAMLNDGRSHLFDAPHLIVFPGGATMLAVLAFNFLGDGLREMLNPRLRRQAALHR